MLNYYMWSVIIYCKEIKQKTPTLTVPAALRSLSPTVIANTCLSSDDMLDYCKVCEWYDYNHQHSKTS